MFLYRELVSRAPLPAHEILLQARGQLEARHRERVHRRATMRALRPCTLPFLSEQHGPCSCPTHQDLSRLTVDDAQDCCNKTVPIYLVPSANRSFHLLSEAFHNWLYRKWFWPYRSDIEYGQFIAKIIVPQHLPQDISLAPLAKRIIEVNQALCAQVAHVQKNTTATPMNSGAPSLTPVGMTFPSNDFFILQPLFRALVIVLLTKDYHIRVADIGQFPVLVVLTGIEDGLSAPLSLEPLKDNVDRVIYDTAVQVPLGVAVDFVLALEQREIAAFGPQPDPVESTKNMQDGCSFSLDSYPRAMKKLGWGDEPITGPSSTWVDDEKYPEWSGDGAINDKNYYAQMEKTYRWFLLCAMAGISTVPANSRPGRRRQSI